MKVAILAGGLGSRLGALTDHRPKCLVEVSGKLFIDWQLELLKRHGLTDIVMSTGLHGAMIRNYLGDHPLGMNVEYCHEAVPLGTGGAIAKALPQLGEAFYVLYGDSYLDFDYQALRLAWEQTGRNVLAVYRNDNQWDKSNVLMRGNRIVWTSKKHWLGMRHIDYGVSVMTRQIFDLYGRCLRSRLNPDVFDLNDVHQYAIAHCDMEAVQVHKRFYEIGSPAGLEETCRHLSENTSRESNRRLTASGQTR